ncbi:MAG: CHAT domain-containing tetratricopeptide repeat protein, partial [Bacteroidota bacterium]
YNDLGLYFEATGDYAKALNYYQQALAIFSKQKGPESHYTADSYERIGHCYFQTNDYAAAIQEFTRSLTIKESILGDRHPEVADLYVKLARCYPDRPMQSLDLCAQSLQRMGVKPEKMNRIPASIRAPLPILNAFETRGEILLNQFRNSGKSSWLKQAERNNQLALQVIDYARKMYQEPGSKQLLLASYARLFEQGIGIHYELYQRSNRPVYLNRAFAIAESSKNVALLEASQAANTQTYSNVPIPIQDRQRALSIDINYYENAQFALEKESGPDKAIRLRNLQNQIFDLKEQYFALIDTIQNLYPDYYQMRYGAPNIQFNELQNTALNTEETLLEYFVGERFVYLFVAAPEEQRLLRMAADFPLAQRVRDLRDEIKSPHTGTGPSSDQLDNYAYLSGQLYDYLLAPAEPFLKTSNLVIVPDGVLGYLPFETLTIPDQGSVRSWKDFHYLIEEYTISYSYAASLLPHLQATQGLEYDQEMVAVAPKFQGKKSSERNSEFLPNLPALSHNEEEAKAIGDITGGIVLTGEEASEANFLRLSPNSRMLHLATHAQANDSIGLQSYLAFTPMPDSIENEMLFVRDLYNLEIPAELVVLSACETGLGQFQGGEGIISLGRGFLYAGAKSIVTTLWSIDDRSTSRIMEDFYEQLKMGKRKDEALRQAKMNYLEKSSGVRSHPLFWAAYIPVGDMKPLDLEDSKSKWHWWISALLPVLIIARLSARKEGTRFFFF